MLDAPPVQLTRKQLLAQALFNSKDGEIRVCDSCEGYVLGEHMHTYVGSMCKEWSVCPECDLPEKWSTKFSTRRGMRYFIYFDPSVGAASRVVQWNHPTEGNPLHAPARPEVDEKANKRKREH